MSEIPIEILKSIKEFIPRDRDMKSRTSDIMKKVIRPYTTNHSPNSWGSYLAPNFCEYYFRFRNKSTWLSQDYIYPYTSDEDSDTGDDSENASFNILPNNLPDNYDSDSEAVSDLPDYI